MKEALSVFSNPSLSGTIPSELVSPVQRPVKKGALVKGRLGRSGVQRGALTLQVGGGRKCQGYHTG